MNLIKQNQLAITQLCTKHNVQKLYAFGSVLTDNFNSNSDIDLLVKFNDFDVQDYFMNYSTLKENLEIVLRKKVDLLEEQTLKNPILIRSINKNKQLIYG